MSNMEKTYHITKESSKEQIRHYFEHILELYRVNEKYPINLDEVWMLVYGKKSDAVEALQKNFIQDIDYQVLRQNPQNPYGGRPTNEYFLTIECLEYFIARKVREVFNVYRAVFKKVASGDIAVLPKDYASALRELASKVEENERLMLENKRKSDELEEQRPKVIFADAVIGSQSSCLIGELAKIITQNGYKIGQNRLFEWMRSKHYLGLSGEFYNIPNQRYIEQGLFELKKSTHSENGVMRTTITPKVTGKGQKYFINIFLTRLKNINETIRKD